MKYYKNDNNEIITCLDDSVILDLPEASEEEHEAYCKRLNKEADESNPETKLNDLMDALIELSNLIDISITEQEDALIELADIVAGGEE